MVQEIIALDRAWEDAIIAKDTAALGQLASDDLIYTHAGCLVEGKEGFLGHIADGELSFTSIEYEDIDVRLHGDAAVLTCALHLRTHDSAGQSGELHFRSTHVWIREDERWQLLANQSTFIPDSNQ